MGNSPHLNVSSMSYAFHSNSIDITNVLRRFEKRNLLIRFPGAGLILPPSPGRNRSQSIHSVPSSMNGSAPATMRRGYDNNSGVRSRFTSQDFDDHLSYFEMEQKRIEEEKQLEEALILEKLKKLDYHVSYEEFSQLLDLKDDDLSMHPSDANILKSLFILIDRKVSNRLDLRIVLVAASILIGKSVNDIFFMIFSIVDRAEQHTIDKDMFRQVISVISDTLIYFGDCGLETESIINYVDSVYTSAGLIDGNISYPEYMGAIVEHPIIEILLSKQYQFRAKEKLLSKDELLGATLVL